MNQYKKIPFIAKGSAFSNWIAIFFLALSVTLFILNVPDLVYMGTFIIAFMLSFKDRLDIEVYEDRYLFTYRNLFGRLMETKNVFTYKDTKSISYEVEYWNAGVKETLLALSVDTVIAGPFVNRLFKPPIINIKISTTNGSLEEKFNIQVKYTSMLYLEAIKLIEQKVIEQNRSAL